MVCILWQQKRKTKRIPVDLQKQGSKLSTVATLHYSTVLCTVSISDQTGAVHPGEREDTKW